MRTTYNRNLKPFARKLRKQGTKGEAILWRDVLKARQMKGYQFNRQFIIDNYILKPNSFSVFMLVLFTHNFIKKLCSNLLQRSFLLCCE